MMGTNGRDAAARFAERRRLEDEAPRLRTIAPKLKGCRIEISEGRSDSTTAEIKHVRRVVVDVAPALFMLPCGDPACRDGGHDITNELLRGLRESKTEIEGSDTCFGHTGTAECGRILRFVASCEYEP
jgi:hypothetical protein